MRWNARAAILGFVVALALPIFAQDFAIHEIPPAMNLLTEIPPAQAQNQDQDQGNQAQSNPSQPNQDQTKNDQPSHSQADTNSLPQVETFTGTIGEGSDGYFLKGANGAQYRLDDATKVQPFDGKNVQISGKLELDTNLIHIESIKPAQ